MANQKKCIACAEEIQSSAKLCRFCGTMQNDERFSRVVPKEKPKKAPIKSDCLECGKKLKTGEHTICQGCQFSLTRHELDLIGTGVEIAKCPVCETIYYSPEISSECHSCDDTQTNYGQLLVSWWVQAILVVVAFINPVFGTFSSPAVFLGTVGGQLTGGNALIGLVLGVVYLAMGKNHKNSERIKTWLLSALAFFIMGVFMVILGYAIA